MACLLRLAENAARLVLYKLREGLFLTASSRQPEKHKGCDNRGIIRKRHNFFSNLCNAICKLKSPAETCPTLHFFFANVTIDSGLVEQLARISHARVILPAAFKVWA